MKTKFLTLATCLLFGVSSKANLWVDGGLVSATQYPDKIAIVCEPLKSDWCFQIDDAGVLHLPSGMVIQTNGSDPIEINPNTWSIQLP